MRTLVKVLKAIYKFLFLSPCGVKGHHHGTDACYPDPLDARNYGLPNAGSLENEVR
jgi:hypothetical protein